MYLYVCLCKCLLGRVCVCVCVCRCGFWKSSGRSFWLVSGGSVVAEGKTCCTVGPEHNWVIFGMMLGNRWKGKLRGGLSLNTHTHTDRQTDTHPGGGAQHCICGEFWPTALHCQEFLSSEFTFYTHFKPFIHWLKLFPLTPPLSSFFLTTSTHYITFTFSLCIHHISYSTIHSLSLSLPISIVFASFYLQGFGDMTIEICLAIHS